MMVWLCESVSDTHMFKHARKGESKRVLPSASQLPARSEGILCSMLIVKTPNLPSLPISQVTSVLDLVHLGSRSLALQT